METLELQVAAMREELREFMERTSNPLPLVLTKERAARELSIGLTKLRQLIKGGVLSTVEIGDTFMVPASEVLRLSQPKDAPVRPSGPRKSRSLDVKAEAAKARAALRKRD